MSIARQITKKSKKVAIRTALKRKSLKSMQRPEILVRFVCREDDDVFRAGEHTV
jgi:hypothetical protein